jgi:hypothetical protein
MTFMRSISGFVCTFERRNLWLLEYGGAGRFNGEE